MIESISGIMNRIEDIQQRIGQIQSLSSFSPVQPIQKYTPQSTPQGQDPNKPQFSQILSEVMGEQGLAENQSISGLDLGKINLLAGGDNKEAQLMLQKLYQQSQNNSEDLNEIIKDAALTYDLDPNLIKAVIKQESQFTQTALSPKGAQGYMQLMPKTAELLGVKDSNDPRENIMGGSKYLRIMLDKYKGDVVKTLAAYNAGPNAVDKAGGIPNIAETKDYVNRVLQHYYEYNRLEDSGVQTGG